MRLERIVSLEVSQAEVLAADPQVIILNWAGLEVIDPARVAARPGWERISAVRDGRVLAVDELLLNAPGPNLVDGAWQVWRILAEAGQETGKEGGLTLCKTSVF